MIPPIIPGVRNSWIVGFLFLYYVGVTYTEMHWSLVGVCAVTSVGIGLKYGYMWSALFIAATYMLSVHSMDILMML